MGPWNAFPAALQRASFPPATKTRKVLNPMYTTFFSVYIHTLQLLFGITELPLSLLSCFEANIKENKGYFNTNAAIL